METDLVSYGWCKADIHCLAQRLSCLHLYCLKSLGPRKAFRDHYSCSDQQCQARDSSPRHLTVGCACEFIESVSDKVASITAHGDIPLVIFAPKMEVKIQPVEESRAGTVVPYIAISHICADGLGDYKKNIMYPCQLQLLQERVNAVFARLLSKYGVLPELFPALFWIDTLCVTGKPGPEKTKAVSVMQKCYRSFGPGPGSGICRIRFLEAGKGNLGQGCGLCRKESSLRNSISNLKKAPSVSMIWRGLGILTSSKK